MKKFFYFVVMALFLAGMTACEKDPDENGGGGNNSGNGGNTGNGPLVGTEWVLEETETETDDGVTYDLYTSITINFTTSKDGKVVEYGRSSVGGQVLYEDSEELPFTYTYDGTATAGRGTITAIDEETNEPEIEQFAINGDKLIITGEDEDGPYTYEFTRK